MTFHSLAFLVFFLFVFGVYWVLRQPSQNIFLIAASLFFYGFIHPWFLLPFLATAILDYFFALGIERFRERGRFFVTLSVSANLGLLGFFKYYNFFVGNVSILLAGLHLSAPLPLLNIVLPVGISFYTFQSIGYVIDVYRRHVPACRSLRDYTLFVAFFPLLVAGPIQRAGDLLSQIQQTRTLTPEVAWSALLLIIWGLLKKLVIADNVALISNKVFALASPSFPILWVGVLAFCVQIYADFSAYTDMARGTARLLGFELSPNFNHPYLADSPSDFWRRWHISLSTWIRDYIYIPLGGSRRDEGRTLLNLTIVFLLVGFWHGASWNFILWGLYYAILNTLYRAAAVRRASSSRLMKVSLPFRILLMFILTNIGWLIFREQSIRQLAKDFALSPFVASRSDWQVAYYLLATLFLYSLPLFIHTFVDVVIRPLWEGHQPAFQYVLASETIIAMVLLTGVLLLHNANSSAFIYFQF